MDRNTGLLERYFHLGDSDTLDDAINKKSELYPKVVKIDYPINEQDNNGSADFVQISVPLITLVPLSMSQIDKVVLTNHFKTTGADANNNSLKIEFASSQEESNGTLEVHMCPHEIAQGMRLIVEGYDAILKRQIPH